VPLASAARAAPVLSDRRWPLICSVLSVAVGCAVWFGWGPLVLHRAAWLTPGDMWSTFRAAHWVAWGDFGGVYASGTQLVSFPGLLLLLAPMAALTGSLGLSENLPFTLAHPGAWVLLGPYEVLLGSLSLFAFDALAQRLGVGTRRRAMLCLTEAVILFNVTALWGHPEDAVALGLAAYALTFAFDRRWAGAGWLFGAAVAVQPLVLLMLPVLASVFGGRRVPGLLVRAAAPALALLSVPLVEEFRATSHALVDQPNFPNVDHATPWTALAPRLAGHGHSLAVAGGPGRVLAVLLACAIGVRARHWRHRPDLLVWGAALAMAGRCFTESVMDPYYIWPALALALVAAAAAPNALPLLLTGFLAAAGTVYADFHLSLWAWWLPVMGAIVAVLSTSLPMYRMDLAVRRTPRPPTRFPGTPGSLAGAAR